MKQFAAQDLFHYHQLSALKADRAGTWVVFSCKQAIEQTDDYQITLWGLRNDNDASPRQLTSAVFSASSPALHPDGRTLAFLSARGDDGLQLHMLPLTGGEVWKVSHAKDQTLNTIEQWSQDGSRVLVTASVEGNEDGEDAQRPKGRPPAVATYLPYKQDGSGITTGRRTHLFAVDATDGAVSALTEGDFDVASGAWSPDGRQLVYVRHRSGRMRHRTDLWLAEAQGQDARCIVDRFASIASVAWSPDGTRLLIAAGEEEGDSSVGLWCFNADGTNAVRLGGDDFELLSSGKALWHPDGGRVAAIAESRGLHRVALIDVAANTVRCVTPAQLQSVEDLSACGDRLYYVGISQHAFDEIHSVDWQGEDRQVHSSFNSWLEDYQKPRVSLRSFKVPDGDGGQEEIDAWVLLPAEGAGHGDGPYPLLVDMHGGPHSVALVDFSAHTYWYLLLSMGWAVVAPNAVGSTSYGVSFARRLRGRWGELDWPQYEAVVRALQDEGIAGDRLACGGKSYGGFLSAWAIGHSDLFDAAAVAAPVANIESHMGTSDTGYYVTPFAMACEPREHPELYRRLSPVTACHAATTATLILQGENDGRCPRGQSEELFARLIRCTDVPVELVLYPESTHAEAESGRPSNRVDYHGRIADWFGRHVDAPANSKRK